jgi:D-tyrosyl-tRNA(Tyr) deacylase
MRAVLQRVSQARVEVDGQVVGAIGRGLLVLLGVAAGDTERDGERLAAKIVGLRIFDDPAGKMNLSVQEAGGAILLVSQFTLLGDARRGRRPSFAGAAPSAEAGPLYLAAAACMRGAGVPVATGLFQARMRVHLTNDGPVTLLLDTRETDGAGTPTASGRAGG